MRSDDQAFAIFQLLQVPGIGPARLSAMLTHAEELHSSLTGLVAEDNGLGAMLDGEQIRSLRANASKNFEVWQKVRDLGGRVLSYLDPDYPDSLRLQLGRQAPPLLFTRGNLSLLSRPSLGFCGSRKASEKGLAVAEECARMVSTDGINVISGYAAGVDMATHRAALQSGGTTAIVLPEGILHFRIKQDIKDIWDWQRVLVISQYPPGLTWSVRNAMLRNQTICGLCRVMVLIEARETGGSMEAGRTCLKLGIPLFAPVYDGMPEFARGNQILLHEGARSLYKSKSTNLPNLRNLMSAFEEPVEQ